MMEFIGYIIHDTGKAILFHDHYWSAPDWMPKSQITIHTEIDTHEVRLVASDWISKQKGIREFEYREVQEYKPDA